MICLHSFSLFVIPQRARIISLGNAFRKVQNAAVTFTDPVVAAHGNITKHGDFLIAAARLLPRFDQRAIMKINVQFIVGALEHIHLKNKLSRLVKQDLLQPFQTVRSAFSVRVGKQAARTS